MNVKRYTARTARDALALVRQALGDDAVVLSTKPTAGGVEVLAMAAESIGQVEQLAAASGSAPAAAAASTARARAARLEPSLDATSVEQDVSQLEMSTLSFQDYVRERMLKKRQAALSDTGPSPAPTPRPAAA